MKTIDTYRTCLASPCLDPATTWRAETWARVRIWARLNRNLFWAMFCALAMYGYANCALIFVRDELYPMGVLMGLFYTTMVWEAIRATWRWVCERLPVTDGGAT